MDFLYVKKGLRLAKVCETGAVPRILLRVKTTPVAHGRLKDVIVRDGVEIHPVEVEEVIYQVPEVSEVQVFGFPHPEKGQEVAAWVKLKEGAEKPLVALAALVKDLLDEKNMPHYFKIVNDYPMTRSGKVQKFKLAEMARKEYLDV